MLHIDNLSSVTKFSDIFGIVFRKFSLVQLLETLRLNTKITNNNCIGEDKFSTDTAFKKTARSCSINSDLVPTAFAIIFIEKTKNKSNSSKQQ